MMLMVPTSDNPSSSGNPSQAEDNIRTEKKRRKPESELKVARINVPVVSAKAERYRKLSETTGIPLTVPARLGLELWEAAGGRLPQVRPGRSIPVLGYIPGGPGCLIRPLEECFVSVSADFANGLRGDEYFLIVNGDSMCSAKLDSIADGEYALFAPDRDPCGHIAHIEWENEHGERELTLKRFHCGANDTVILKPSNPDYEPIVKRRSEVSVRGVFLKKWAARQ